MLSTAAVAINYNNLLELDEADSGVNQVNRDEIIRNLLSIIKRNGMGDCVGIRLLHKHNTVELDEIMAEYHRIDDDGFALITKATKQTNLSGTYVPNSWQLSEGIFVPIEFSEERLVRRPNVNPENYSGLFSELSSELQRTESFTFLGPSLLGSDFIDKHRPKGHSILAETTAHDDRANVLRFAKPEPIASSASVQTHWCVSPSSQDGTVTMTCTKICPSVQNPPVHQGTYIHKTS